MAWKRIGRDEWKKVGLNEYTIVSVSNIGKKYVVGVVHEDFISPRKSKAFNKFYKTRIKAMKFAKEYMKKY